MIDGDQNLIEDLNWDREGFSVVNFLTPTDMGQLKSAVKAALTKIIFEVTGSELNNLEDYHRVVDDQDHRAVTKFTYNRLFLTSLALMWESLRKEFRTSLVDQSQQWRLMGLIQRFDYYCE
jgi:hypothetical protein